MAVKPINELAPRTPSSTDVLAVADPFNGQTGKSTAAQILNTGSQLTTKTPVPQDTLIVNDATTGVAGKASIAEVISNGVSSFGSSGAFQITPAITDPNIELFKCYYTGQLSYRGWNQPLYGFQQLQQNNLSGKIGGNITFQTQPNHDQTSNTTSITCLLDQFSGNFYDFYNLTSLSFPNAKKIYINNSNCPRLASISIPEAEEVFLYAGTGNNTGKFIQNISIPKAKFFKLYLYNTYSVVQSVSAPEAELGEIQITNFAGTADLFPSLTTVNFPKLKAADSIYLGASSSLVSISFPELLHNFGGMILNHVYAQTLNFPKLLYTTSIANYTTGFWASAPYLTSMNFPLLKKTLSAPFGAGQNSPITFNVLTTISLPSFTKWGLVKPTWANNSSTTPTGYTTDGGQFAVTNSPMLTTINLPNLEFAGASNNISFNVTSCAALTTFTVKQTPMNYGGNFICTGAALNQASVDGILVALAYMDGTNNAPYPAYSSRTVNLSGGTSATPSATGLAAKATLVARGCTVTHN